MGIGTEYEKLSQKTNIPRTRLILVFSLLLGFSAAEAGYDKPAIVLAQSFLRDIGLLKEMPTGTLTQPTLQALKNFKSLEVPGIRLEALVKLLADFQSKRSKKSRKLARTAYTSRGQVDYSKSETGPSKGGGKIKPLVASTVQRSGLSRYWRAIISRWCGEQSRTFHSIQKCEAREHIEMIRLGRAPSIKNLPYDLYVRSQHECPIQPPPTPVRHFGCITNMVKSIDPVLKREAVTVIRQPIVNPVIGSSPISGNSSAFEQAPKAESCKARSGVSLEASCAGPTLTTRSKKERPSLDLLDSFNRSVIEIHCSPLKHREGTSKYYRCLGSQLIQLSRISPRLDLTNLSRSMRFKVDSQCAFLQRKSGIAEYYNCAKDVLDF